jgi:hypothetical protein
MFVSVDRLSHRDCGPNAPRCGPSSPLDIGLRPIVGQYSDSFSITTNDPETPVATVRVVGEVVADMVTGSVIGLDAAATTCRNVRTGQAVELSDFREVWNCTKGNFAVQAGDLIMTRIRGRVSDQVQ